jgi:glutaredoxin
MRCEAHALACGPDGRCVLCRRSIADPFQASAHGKSPRLGLHLAAITLMLASLTAYRVVTLQVASTPHAGGTSVVSGGSLPGAVKIIVYTTDWCPVCKRAKAWMKAQGIAYEERDVEGSREYGRAMRAINPRGSVPTFDVDGDILIGFNENGLVEAMTRATQRAQAGQHL